MGLLKNAGITAIADVRSAPYSRRNPQFNREDLNVALRGAGLAYSYLGTELGGHPKDPALWRGARPNYERVAATPLFCDGLGRVEKGARAYRIAIMCAEREPLECHRCLLVARALKARRVSVMHILGDGVMEEHTATESRMMAWAKIAGPDMFDDRATRLADAYRKRAGWIWGER